MTTFVLLHGAFHGAWCWSRVAEPLRAAGHEVLTPTQTGLGERANELAPGVTIDTFVQDLIDVLRTGCLHDAVLVGHSFGGIAISGAADRVPGRIKQLIYLDSVILQNGERPADQWPPDLAAERHQMGKQTGGLSVAAPDPSRFGVPPGPDAEWVRSQLTPHPYGTFVSPLHLSNPIGNGLPATYIACMDPEYLSLASSKAAARVMPGWAYREIPTGHNPMITAPDLLVALLEELTQ